MRNTLAEVDARTLGKSEASLTDLIILFYCSFESCPTLNPTPGLPGTQFANYLSQNHPFSS
jgi:hypothetical protein